MTDMIDDFKRRFDRRAIIMEIGGFRPTDILSDSWFGRVNLGAVEESWPFYDGHPLQALAQINLTKLPFRTPGLDDIDFIAVFISSQKLPMQQDQNGSSWVLRTYHTISDLVPLVKPEINTAIKPFPMRPQVVDHDFPSLDNIPLDIKVQLLNTQLIQQFKNMEGFKLGGWPTTIQSEIDWGSQAQLYFRPEYIFQIDSTEKAQWMWGDTGIGYFGRGTLEEYRDRWVLDWQGF